MLNIVGQSKLEDVVFKQQQVSVTPRLRQLNEVDNLIRSSLINVVKEERRNVVKQLVDNRFDLAQVSFVGMQKKVKDKLWLLWWKSWQVVDDVSFAAYSNDDSVAEFEKKIRLVNNSAKQVNKVVEGEKAARAKKEQEEAFAAIRRRLSEIKKTYKNADETELDQQLLILDVMKQQNVGYDKNLKEIEEVYRKVERAKFGDVKKLSKNKREAKKLQQAVNRLEMANEKGELSEEGLALLEQSQERLAKLESQIQNNAANNVQQATPTTSESTYGELDNRVAAERLRKRKEKALDVFEKRQQRRLAKAQKRYGDLLEQDATLPDVSDRVARLEEEVKQLKEGKIAQVKQQQKQTSIDPKIQKILEDNKISIKGKSIDEILNEAENIEDYKDSDAVIDYFGELDPEALTKGVTTAKVEGEKITGELKRKQRQLDYWRKRQQSVPKTVPGLKKGRQLLAIEREQQRQSARNRELFLTTERNVGNDRNNAVDYFVGESDFGRVYLETRLDQISKQFVGGEQEQILRTMDKIYTTETGEANKSTSIIQQYFENNVLTYDKKEKVSYELGGDKVDQPKFAPTVAGKRLDNKKPVVTSKQRNNVKLYNQVEKILYQENDEVRRFAQSIIDKNPNKEDIALTESERVALGIVKKQATYKLSTIKKYTKQKQSSNNLAFRVGRIVRTELAAANHLGRLTHIVLNDNNGLVKWVVDDEHDSRGVVCLKAGKNDRFVGNSRIVHAAGCNGRASGRSIGVGKADSGIYRTVDVLQEPSLFVPVHPFCLCSVRPLTKEELNNDVLAPPVVAEAQGALLTGLGLIGAGQVTAATMENYASPKLKEDKPETWGVMQVGAAVLAAAAGVAMAAYVASLVKYYKMKIKQGDISVPKQAIQPQANKEAARQLLKEGVQIPGTKEVDTTSLRRGTRTNKLAQLQPNVEPLPDLRTLERAVDDRTALPDLSSLERRPLELEEVFDDFRQDNVKKMLLSESEADVILGGKFDELPNTVKRTYVNFGLEDVNVPIDDDVLAKQAVRVNEKNKQARKVIEDWQKANVVPPVEEPTVIDFVSKLEEPVKVGEKTTMTVIKRAKQLDKRLNDVYAEYLKLNTKNPLTFTKSDLQQLRKLRSKLQKLEIDRLDFEYQLSQKLKDNTDRGVSLKKYYQQLSLDAEELGVEVPEEFSRYVENQYRETMMRENILDFIQSGIDPETGRKFRRKTDQILYVNKIKNENYRSFLKPNKRQSFTFDNDRLVTTTGVGEETRKTRYKPLKTKNNFVDNLSIIIKELVAGNQKVISKSQIRYLVEKHGDDNNILQRYLRSKGTPKLQQEEVAQVVELLKQEQEVIRKAEFRKKFAQRSNINFTRRTTSSFFKPNNRYNFK